MKTIKDYISEAEKLINEYKTLNASRNAFYDENVRPHGEDNAELYIALHKWSKMIDDEDAIIRKAIKAIKNCYRLFGIELPKKIDEFNMEDHFRSFKWLSVDIDNQIRQYRFFFTNN